MAKKRKGKKQKDWEQPIPYKPKEGFFLVRILMARPLNWYTKMIDKEVRVKDLHKDWWFPVDLQPEEKYLTYIILKSDTEIIENNGL